MEYSVVVDRIARNPKLSIKQMVAIRSLARHGSKWQAAKDAGIGYMTMWRWWNKDEDFYKAVIELKRALLEQDRAELVRELEEWAST